VTCHSSSADSRQVNVISQPATPRPGPRQSAFIHRSPDANFPEDRTRKPSLPNIFNKESLDLSRTVSFVSFFCGSSCDCLAEASSLTAILDSLSCCAFFFAHTSQVHGRQFVGSMHSDAQQPSWTTLSQPVHLIKE
jgi:hypothetical protein